MSEPENFLSRWSRRKREAEEAPDATHEADVAAPATDVAPGDVSAPTSA